MGLTECVSPIMQQGHCLGFIMLGQTASGQEDGFEKIREKIKAYSLDEQKAFSLYSLIQFSPTEKVRAAVSIMDACAGYLYLHKLISAGESMGARLNAYILGNLKGDLSVDRLCRVFKLSRVDLYACFKHAFQTTPAEFIKRARLERAKELLETPLSVTQIARETIGKQKRLRQRPVEAEPATAPRPGIAPPQMILSGKPDEHVVLPNLKCLSVIDDLSDSAAPPAELHKCVAHT